MHIISSFISLDGSNRAGKSSRKKGAFFFSSGIDITTWKDRTGQDSTGTYFFGLAVLRFVGEKIFLHRPRSSIPVKINRAVGDVTNPELAGRRQRH